MKSIEPTRTRSAARLERSSHRTADIDVWMIRLDTPDWRDSLEAGDLSDQERQRAERFPFEPERRRFVICRAALRAILRRYLGTRSGELSFHYGPYGKPRLDPAGPGGTIHFNVAHSDDLALVAVSRGHELGVDIERVRPRDGLEDIVAREFAPAERLALRRALPTGRLSMFYRYWTLKEAYLKASGLGMSQALREVDITAAEDHPLELPDACGTGTRRWTGRTLEPAAEYIAALVVEGHRVPRVAKTLEWSRRGSPAGANAVGDTGQHHG